MIEMRWLKKIEERECPLLPLNIKVLQYREKIVETFVDIDGNAVCGYWSEWIDVPTVVEEE